MENREVLLGIMENRTLGLHLKGIELIYNDTVSG